MRKKQTITANQWYDESWNKTKSKMLDSFMSLKSALDIPPTLFFEFCEEHEELKKEYEQLKINLKDSILFEMIHTYANEEGEWAAKKANTNIRSLAIILEKLEETKQKTKDDGQKMEIEVTYED